MYYVYSQVYWAITTLTTVGYGDIGPTNDAERCYELGTLLITALIFSLLLSTISELVAKVDQQAALADEKIEAARDFMNYYKMPRELRAKVRRYYEYYFSKHSAVDASEILSSLNTTLRAQVMDCMVSKMLKDVPLFQELDRQFKEDALLLLTPLSFAAKEVILERGDAVNDLFFLIKGEVIVTTRTNTMVDAGPGAMPALEGIGRGRLYVGDCFGQEVCVDHPTGESIKSKGTFIAATKCELFVLSKSNVDALFEQHPLAAPKVKETLMENMSPHLREVIDSAGELVEASKTPRGDAGDATPQIAALAHAVQGLQAELRKISSHLNIK